MTKRFLDAIAGEHRRREAKMSGSSKQRFGPYGLSVNPAIIRISIQLFGQPLRLKMEEQMIYTPPTLATLPPDIIRNIVQLSANPNQLRGISRTWNSVVLEGRYIPLDGMQLVIKDNNRIIINLRIFKEFLHHFSTKTRETAKVDELNSKLLNVELVRPLNSSFKLSSILKHICRIKSVWMENVDWRSVDLLIGSFGSIPIERLTVRVKKDASKNEYKYITEQAAKVNARHRVII